jgi:hypothetical protein
MPEVPVALEPPDPLAAPLEVVMFTAPPVPVVLFPGGSGCGLKTQPTTVATVKRTTR